MEQYKLRGYQIAAVEKGLDVFRRKARGIIVAPTAAGKSLMIASIAKELKGNTIVFQPSAEILTQNLEKARSYGIEDIGVFSASLKQKTIGQLTFATIGTVYNRPEMWDTFDNVIVDESHNIGQDGGMYEQFIEAHGGAVLGLTATPYRLHTFNDMKTGQPSAVVKFLTRTRPRTFTELSHVIQIQELYAQGFLCPLSYTQNPSYNHSAIALNSTGADFSENAVKEYNKKMKLDEAVREAILKADKKHILVFTRFVEDAHILVNGLKSDGITASVVSAETHPTERQRVIQDFKDGIIRVIANVGVMGVGFDFPALDCVILARPTQSVALYYQQIGRGMRHAPGKESTEIIDLCGNVRRFGRVETFEIGNSPDNGLIRLKSEAGWLSGVDFVSGVDLEARDVVGHSGASGDVVTFGKFNGTPITKLPASYLTWAVTTFSPGSKWHTIFTDELGRRNPAR